MESVGCVLSDRNIISEYEKGNIVIDPFDARKINNCSVDVSLGMNYYRSNSNMKTMNPWVETEIKQYWGGAQVASVAKEGEYGLKEGQEYILINPGETLLCHSNEFIGGRGNITTMMKTRSSIMRSALSFCKCAGWGDSGYINRWTFEVTNHSQTTQICLPVGARVAQIVFMYTGSVENSYEKKGKYQTSDDLEVIKREWSVESMLPKLYKELGV